MSGNEGQEDNGIKHRMEAVPEGQTTKAPPKPLRVVSTSGHADKQSILFYIPFHCVHQIGRASCRERV